MKLDSYKKLGKDAGKMFWLDIAGGEPFLRKDLVEIIECFDAEVVQIPTNGSLQKQIFSMADELEKRVKAEVSISLSLDGLKEHHDKVRGTPGNFDQVWDTFEKLREYKGIKVKINTVLTRDNKDQILELMQLVRKRNPDFHSIILLRGDPIDENVSLPDMNELLEIGPKIFEILETYDYGKGGMTAFILRNYHRYLWNLSLKTLQQRTQVIPCLAGTAHKIVMGNGDVSSCEMLPPVGNINDKGWSEIMDGAAFKEQLQSIKDKKCFCTHNCAMLDSILFNVGSIPHLMHQKIKSNK
jgi:MoaA/NifB/PqqE/SkfB family radical SAM enzyme